MKKSYYLGIFFLVLALLFGGFAVYEYHRTESAGQEYEELKQQVTEESNPAKEQPEIEEKSTVEIPIDFEALQRENPDIYAWIRVPGTTVDYPIVQSSTDNQYYLNHAVSGEEKAEGAIFTENYNEKDFDDPNTVIYGHDMKNGSMFQSLHRFMDRSFFDENREILIYLPDRILHYEIFAAYLYDNRHLLHSFDFWDQKVYQQYLDTIFSMRDMKAFVDKDVKVNTEDRILTLSTCYARMKEKRYLVQGVLQKVEE